MILIARKTKLSDEMVSISVQNIKLGLTRTACAHAIGVSYETWRTWESLGREGKEPYSRFYIAIQEAEADLMRECLEKVKKAADLGNFQAVVFLLERRFSDQWGKQSQLNVNAKTQSQNFNVNADVDLNNFEEAERIRQDILAKLARPVHDAGNPTLNIANGRED